MSREGGKGDKQRPTDMGKYRTGYQGIFGRKWQVRDPSGKVLKSRKSFEECKEWADDNLLIDKTYSIVEST